MEIPTNKTTILHQIDPSSQAVKTLYDVFSWGREAMGEYLYYGEIESCAVMEDGTGDLSKANIFLQVDVSFEKDVIGTASANLYRYKANSYDRFSIKDTIDSVPMVSMTPESLSAAVNSSNYTSVIDIDETSFSALNIYSDIQVVFFEFNKIEQDRVIEIKVWAKGNDVNIEWMHLRFADLVSQYKHIPMNIFTGAVRE